jgi:hypothetical protein
MTAPTLDTDVNRYLAAVRDALADLDSADRDDLLEDLEGHLEELRAEDPTVDLQVRLGDATSYAEELRLSAGLPPRDPESRLTLGERLDRTRAALGHLVGSWPGGRAALEFLVQLRPVWWVLRGYGVVAVVGKLWHGSNGWQRSLLPTIHGSRVLGFVALLGLVIASVRCGRSTVMSSGGRRVVLGVGNVVLAVATVGYLAGISFDRVETVVIPPCCGTVYGPNGTPLSNIYAYDENGKAISRVQLFDQDGQPLDITVNDSPFGYGPSTVQLHNVFPQRQVLDTVGNPDGTVQEVPRPAPVIAAPHLSPSPTAAPAAPKLSPTPSPTP